MSQVRVLIRDVVARSGRPLSSASSVMLAVPDRRGLYAADVMTPAENEKACVLGTRVRIYYPASATASARGVAEIEIVVDPDQGAPAFAVAAAIERKTGAESVVVDGAGYGSDPFTQGTLYPIGAWRQRWAVRTLRPGCLAFAVEVQVPPATQAGHVHPVHAVELKDGTIVDVKPLFDTPILRRAIDPRGMYLETRIAWLMTGMGANIEEVCSQVVTLPSGNQRRICELVVHAASDVRPDLDLRLNVLTTLFGFWRTDFDDLDRSPD
ncbi:MAG: hypothetical protein L6Q35_05265 [Phycisphaerales bacterium]|nr:hypothetical protein [Phycisphaerales bacterium]